MDKQKEEILSPEAQLKIVKLESYYSLLSEFSKSRRLKMHRNVNYSLVNWITALTSFFDDMFSEANEPAFSKKYERTFRKIEELDLSKDITYTELLVCTRDMMKFADETGITKISKFKENNEQLGGAFSDVNE